ncbi:MAG: peptidoglycan recognition family protein [Planctomycetota bacterium]
MKTLDFLLTLATFITFVIAVYIFSTDPTITKSINWAEDRVPQNEALIKSQTQNITSTVTTSPNALLKQGNSSLPPKADLPKAQGSKEKTASDNKDYPPNPAWKYIVIHHSATKQGNARIFDNYHRKEKGMKEGLAYHFVIGNGTKSKDGEIEIGNRWKKQIAGEHCWNTKMNQESIGICLVGNFDESKPTPKQIESLINLISNLQKQYHTPSEMILSHKDVDKKRTDCPGKYFPAKEIKSRLNSF